MSERVKKVPLWLFGLVVAGALAFGAQRAMATPVFLTCPGPPLYNGGECSSQAECAENCEDLFGEYEIAQCVNPPGCCRCIL